MSETPPLAPPPPTARAAVPPDDRHARIDRLAVGGAVVGLVLLVGIMQVPKPLPGALEAATVSAAIALGCAAITAQRTPVSRTSRVRNERLADLFFIVRVMGVLATATALAMVLSYLYTAAFVAFLVLAVVALGVTIFGR
jgi:hypothetical protein